MKTNYSILFICGLLFPLLAIAQQLPEVQTKSIALPNSVKIDGRPDEWGSSLQAYNSATSVYYTVANDKNKLYVFVQIKDPTIIRKIINGGITLTINPFGKRDDKYNSSITYPVFSTRTVSEISVDLSTYKMLKQGADGNSKQLDSLLTHINKAINDDGKTISVKGLNSVQDSILSVYNNQGIRLKALFDSQWVLNYEISVPLKLLNSSESEIKTIKYNIMLNGIPQSSKPVIINTAAQGQVRAYATPHGLLSTSSNRSDRSAILFPTDFWGDYTLLK